MITAELEYTKTDTLFKYKELALENYKSGNLGLDIGWTLDADQAKEKWKRIYHAIEKELNTRLAKLDPHDTN